jgi:hypothetical protein
VLGQQPFARWHGQIEVHALPPTGIQAAVLSVLGASAIHFLIAGRKTGKSFACCWQPRSDGLWKWFDAPPIRPPRQRLERFALAPGVPCLDSNRHQGLASGQGRVLIALAA